MTMHTLSLVCIGLLGLAGCQQGLGDRCQLQSDCQTGLTCVATALGGTGGYQTPQGGICMNEGPFDMTGQPAPDLYSPPADLSQVSHADLATSDANTDAH